MRVDETFPKLVRTIFDVRAFPILEETGPEGRSKVCVILSHVAYGIRYRVLKDNKLILSHPPPLYNAFSSKKLGMLLPPKLKQYRYIFLF